MISKRIAACIGAIIFLSSPAVSVTGPIDVYPESEKIIEGGKNDGKIELSLPVNVKVKNGTRILKASKNAFLTDGPFDMYATDVDWYVSWGTGVEHNTTPEGFGPAGANYWFPGFQRGAIVVFKDLKTACPVRSNPTTCDLGTDVRPVYIVVNDVINAGEDWPMPDNDYSFSDNHGPKDDNYPRGGLLHIIFSPPTTRKNPVFVTGTHGQTYRQMMTGLAYVDMGPGKLSAEIVQDLEGTVIAPAALAGTPTATVVPTSVIALGPHRFSLEPPTLDFGPYEKRDQAGNLTEAGTRFKITVTAKGWGDFQLPQMAYSIFAPTAAPANPRVFLLAAGAKGNPDIAILKSELPSSGVRIFGVDEKVPNPKSYPVDPAVIYFNEVDKGFASVLKSYVKRRLFDKAKREVGILKKSDPAAKNGYVEIWLGR